MIRKIVDIGALIFIAAIGWKIGEHMTDGALNMALGVIFGMMFGLPAALIAYATSNRTQEPTAHRVDIYAHLVAETPPVPATQPTTLTVQPKKWFVVEPTVMVLPTATQGKLGVTR